MKDARLYRASRAILADARKAVDIGRACGHLSDILHDLRPALQAASGMTVGEFLTAFCMAKAAELLLRGGAAVAEIAERVGYESEAAFGRAFRKSRCITLGRFRSGTIRG